MPMRQMIESGAKIPGPEGSRTVTPPKACVSRRDWAEWEKKNKSREGRNCHLDITRENAKTFDAIFNLELIPTAPTYFKVKHGI